MTEAATTLTRAVVVAVLVLGIACYGLWRLYQHRRRERTPRL